MVADHYTCAHCGAGFVTSVKNKIYCSRKCNHAAWVLRNADKHKANREEEKAKAHKFSRVTFNSCVACGAAFTSMRKKKYCSAACKPKSPWASVAPVVKTCARCGSKYAPAKTGGRVSEYCSGECRALAEKASRRAAKSKRRAVIRGATVERVDPFVVFERDRWKCGLCGCDTPIGKRGSYDDNAPELDHIIPLAKGGDHSYRNTQCACRRCNGLKSDKPLGQMLLF